MENKTLQIIEQENKKISLRGTYKEEKNNYNRSFGLFAIVAGGIFGILGIENKSALITICATPLVIDGLEDLITGHHHYCLLKTAPYIKSGIKNIGNYWRKKWKNTFQING